MLRKSGKHVWKLPGLNRRTVLLRRKREFFPPCRLRKCFFQQPVRSIGFCLSVIGMRFRELPNVRQRRHCTRMRPIFSAPAVFGLTSTHPPPTGRSLSSRRRSAPLKVFRRGPQRDASRRGVAVHVDKPRKDEAAGAGGDLWGKRADVGGCRDERQRPGA